MRKINVFKKNHRFNPNQHQIAIQEICRENLIDLLYLFGSAAAGRTSALSDIDMAFYSKNNEAGLAEKLHIAFVKLFRRDDVDLLDLKTANPLACFNAIKHGQLLFCANQAFRIQLEYLIVAKYLSTLHLRREYHRGISRSIMGGNFYAKD